MGFWKDLFGGKEAQTPPPFLGYQLVTDIAPLLTRVGKLTPAQLYKEQPHLRIVVSFIARNVAKTGLHLYERGADNARLRVREGAGVEIFRHPDNVRTDYGLIYSLVATLALYDVAYWWIVDTEDGKRIIEINPTWVVKERGNLFSRPDIDVIFPGSTDVKTIKASELVRFAGWSPDSARGVSAPVDSLKAVLKEQIQAVAYRQQVWERGGRVSSVITRPAGVAWSPEARERFKEDWQNNWAGAGAKAGGTPILEDGMDLKSSGFSPRESEWVEVAKLSQTTVAAAYHVNPTLIGVLDNANYSNVKEFRKSLYGDSLGPLLKQIQAHLNQQLLPLLDLSSSDFYYEFNVAEQLQSTPEEQAMVFSASVGAPWLTRNEVRAMQNLAPIAGGDELITPLNVLAGGLASPRDTAPKTGDVEVKTMKTSAVLVKSAGFVGDAESEAAAKLLSKHASRVFKTVSSKLGAKAEYWDESRWTRELTADIEDLIFPLADSWGEEAFTALGTAEYEYDTGRTRNFLKAMAKQRAEKINSGIHTLITDAIEREHENEDTNLSEELEHSLEVFENARAESLGLALVGAVAGFAVNEAAYQHPARKVVKRWIVNSGSPRASHAAMAGEEVGIKDTFSNGLRWPGDYNAEADETVNCHCSLEVEVTD